MRGLLLIGALLMVGLQLRAQSVPVQVTGVLFDSSDKSPIVGGTVLFVNVKDSTRSRFSTTSETGKFVVKNLERAFYKVKVTSLGFKAYNRMLRVGEQDMDLGGISLEPYVEVLDAVDVVGEVVAVEQKGDTIQYNAAAYKVNPDATTKDLVSKMPGIEVTSSGVTTNGETVQQVLLDGKRFFGQDPLLSLNTIPAEVVDKVEVYDQLSEQAQLTGFNDGNTTKTMNVVTKENKRNGLFGKAYAGYGTENLYKAGGNVNSFNEDQRLTIIGMTNNINQQNFSNEDVAGISGGVRRGFRGGQSGPLFTSNQNGITTTNSLGLNFTDNWGKKITFEGSYFLNNTDNSNNQTSSRESFIPDGNQFYNETQESTTENMNHRLNMRMTYNIDDKSKMILTPQLSFQDSYSIDKTVGATTNALSQILNQTNNQYTSSNLAYSFSNNLIYQRKLNKVGRSISLDINTQLNTTNRENYYEGYELDSLTEYLTDENNYTVGSTITYTEPIGLNGQLSVNYEASYNERTSDKSTYLVETESDVKSFESSLSNNFTSSQFMQRPSIHFMNRKFGNFYDFGLAYQNITLNNDQLYPQENRLSNNFVSLLPTIMGRLEFSGGGDLMMRYSTSTSTPSVSQLQNVIDNSNPLFWSVGNPELEQSYTHSLMMRLGKSNVGKGTSIANFTRGQLTNNYITDATEFMRADSTLAGGLVLARGTQISKPVNMDGYWNVTNNTTVSFTLSFLKSKLNTTAGLTYVRNPGLTNGITNYANTYGANGRVSLVSNFSEKVDFNIGYSAGYNRVENTVQKSADTDYLNQTISGNLNLIFGKGFVYRSDITYLDYRGVDNSFNTYYTLWNMSFAKKFLKNNAGELELSVYDLLRQNQNISQTVSSSYIEETRTEVLQQYFMLTFTYSFRKFG